MTESEKSQEILNLLHELNTTIKSIDSKLNYEVNEVDIDESSGDVHITRKLLKPLKTNTFKIEPSKRFNTLKSESESKSKPKSEKHIAVRNVYNLSKDIEDGVYDICIAMQKYYIDDELNALAYDVRHEPFNSEKYKKKL